MDHDNDPDHSCCSGPNTLAIFLKTGDVVGGSYLLPWIYIIMEWWIIVITSCSKNLKNQNPLKVRDKSGSNDFVCSVIFFFWFCKIIVL